MGSTASTIDDPAGATNAVDLRAAREDIAKWLHRPEHDDGSLAPLMIRFAWHCCGTYDRNKKTGGSNGGTMRFLAEQADPENKGFAEARALVEKVKRAHPRLSVADICVLCGTVAIEATGGPRVPFKVGREDWTEDAAVAVHGKGGCPFGDGAHNPCGSRLPAADCGSAKGCPLGSPAHVREAPTIAAVRATFERLGFDDRETVALILLGHQYGRCHPEVSGNENAWYAFDPAHWNLFEHGLGYLSVYGNIDQFVERTTAKGKRQFEWDMHGLKFMLLISDMALSWDPSYKAEITYYNRNRRQLRKDVATAWQKLIELGCDGRLTPEAT